MRALPLSLLVLLTAAYAASAAELDAMTGDGWYSWRVAAHDQAPSWCCAVWNRGIVTPKTCDLDAGKHFGMSGNIPGQPQTGEVQVYARVDDGEVEQLRVLSSHCAVESKSEIRDLGLVDTDESLDWLERRSDSDDALMAIAMHEGKRPAKMLMDIVKKDGADDEAVFALSLLPEKSAVDSLKSLLENRRLDMRIREQALFWLVQSDSDVAYEYLDRLLTSN